MKFIQVNLIRSILAAVVLSASASVAMAYDHDDKGWFDDQHHHHSFTHHNGHRGYWDHDKSGAKIFITV